MDKLEEDLKNELELRFLKLVSLTVFQHFFFVTFDIMLGRHNCLT